MRRGDALPVMVFIHGGGFLFCSADEYLPHALLDHDVVLVVIQYRLGVLGEYLLGHMVSQNVIQGRTRSCGDVKVKYYRVSVVG